MSRIEELTSLINDLQEKLADPSKCGCDPTSLRQRLEAASKELARLNEARNDKAQLLKG